MHFKMSSAICFNLDHSKILSSGNRLRRFKVLLFTFPKQTRASTFLKYKSLENTVGKGEIARKEQFIIISKSFPPTEELYTVFIKFNIVACKLFQFGTVIYKIMIGKGENDGYQHLLLPTMFPTLLNTDIITWVTFTVRVLNGFYYC